MKRLFIAILLFLTAIPLMAQMEFRVDTGTVITDQEFIPRNTLRNGLVLDMPLTTSNYCDSTMVDFSVEGNNGTNIGLRATVGANYTDYTTVADTRIVLDSKVTLSNFWTLDFTTKNTVNNAPENRTIAESGYTIYKDNVFLASTGLFRIYYGGGWLSVNTTVPTPTVMTRYTITESDSLRLYVDGSYFVSWDVTGMTFNFQEIGSNTAAINRYRGFIADVRAWERALSPSEITELYTGEKSIIVGSPRAELVVRADTTNTTIELRSTGEMVANEFVTNSPLENPVAWYPLGESSRTGTQTADFSVNANHADTTLITYATDRFGNANEAMSFDGVASEVVIGDVSELDYISTSRFTWAAWINVATASEQGVIIGKHDGTDGNLLWWRGDSDILIFRCGGAYNESDPVFTDTGSWVHVCFTFNSGNGVFYRNGVPAGTITPNIDNALGIDAIIGSAENGGPGEYFSGIIDDVLIFNRAFSAADVLALYNLTKP